MEKRNFKTHASGYLWLTPPLPTALFTSAIITLRSSLFIPFAAQPTNWLASELGLMSDE
jgi:hypothetical protein